MKKIIDWLTLNKVQSVQCVTGDHTGISRGKIFPTDKFIEEKQCRLPEGVLLQSACGDLVTSKAYRSLIDERDIDMILKPDANACFLLPWKTEPTAMIIHDCFDQNDKVFDISPRNVLKKVVQLYNDKNWQPIVAPEMELYLTAKSLDDNLPLQPPKGHSGKIESGRQSFGIEAIDEFEQLIKDIYSWCAIQKLNVDIVVHEEGTAQFEFNFNHGDPIQLADQVIVFKRTVKAAAKKHNLNATFMAKPIDGEPASAMHIHQSIISNQDGKNIFSDSAGETELFFNYIAGLQKLTPHVMPMYAPNINSYKRFIAQGATPVNILWGRENRTVGLRIPESPPQARRVENRIPGADANPYLAIAASLVCGYIGMVEKFTPTNETVNRANDAVSKELPLEIESAIQAMQSSELITQYLGKTFVSAYTETRLADYNNFKSHITAWERKYLFASV